MHLVPAVWCPLSLHDLSTDTPGDVHYFFIYDLPLRPDNRETSDMSAIPLANGAKPFVGRIVVEAHRDGDLRGVVVRQQLFTQDPADLSDGWLLGWWPLPACAKVLAA